MNATNSDMLLEALTARTIGEESILAMSTLVASPVPAGVIRYMRAEISNRLADDLLHAPHFSRVASPTAGPDAVREALLTHAAAQYIFPRDEFLAMLENATRFTENYLCRPRWTLSSFLFLDQPAITAETLLRKLEYVSDYAYLPQLLRRMVTHSGKQVITSHECISHITRIDDAVVREHSPRERALLAKPIFQFYLLTPEIENTPIALRPLLLFLEDKQFGPLREYTEGIWHVRGKTEITMEEFVALNEDFATGRASFAPTPTIEEKPPEPAPELTEPPVATPAAEHQESARPATTALEEEALHTPPHETPPLQPESIQGSLSFGEPVPATPVQQELVADEVVQQEEVAAEPDVQQIPAVEPVQPEVPADMPEVRDIPAPEPAPPDILGATPVAQEIPHTEAAPQELVESEPENQRITAAEPGHQAAGETEPENQRIPAPEPERQEAVEAEPESQRITAAEPERTQPAIPAPVAPVFLPPPSLKEMIPSGLRRRFVNVICGKDAEFYDLVIARLDEIYSWPQASTYIRELFEINRIDPFNDTAIAFTDVIQKRCDQSRTAQQ